MTDLKSKILERAADDLSAIERELKNNLKSHLDLVTNVAGHILFSGGKRIRPLLMVLSARVCGYTDSYDKTFSVIFEYLHAATLLHDDVVDKATLRRGKPVAGSIWGNAATVLVGDYLFSRSVSISAKINQIRVIEAIGEFAEDLSEGELFQLAHKGHLGLSEEEYFEVIRRKTAALIRGACRIGAMIAYAPEKEISALSDYGLHLGLAFQMADDLLDYTSETDVLGKEVGADLREGKMTLPVIYALSKANPEDRIMMEKIIKKSNFSIDDFKTLISLLGSYGGIEYTKTLAKDHIAKAKKALDMFAPSETKDLLFMLADFTLERKA